jgi:hypothetical protein
VRERSETLDTFVILHYLQIDLNEESDTWTEGKKKKEAEIQVDYG